MKVEIAHWLGRALPGWLRADVGGHYDMTADDIVRLHNEGYDVMLTHRREPAEGQPLLVCLDEPCGRFKQR